MMRHTLTSIRPATAAIAAVLVLATSPAMAQDAAPVAPAEKPVPAAAPAPEIALPVLTPQAAPAPAVPAASQATEVVQQTPAASPEDAAPAPRAQTRAATPAVTRTAQTVPTTVPAPVQTAPAVAAQPAPADAAPVPAPAVPAEPETVSGSNDGIYWALGGGAALLIGGLGVYALSYRRKPLPETVNVRAEPAPLMTSHVKRADLSFEPVEIAPAAVAAPSLAVAAATDTPHVEAPSLSVEATTLRAAKAGSRSPLEDMVAARPSPENPFVTRKARLRRANYILAHGMPQPLTGDAEPAYERAEEREFKPQQAYTFGKAQNPPRFTWKPATS